MGSTTARTDTWRAEHQQRARVASGRAHRSLAGTRLLESEPALGDTAQMHEYEDLRPWCVTSRAIAELQSDVACRRGRVRYVGPPTRLPPRRETSSSPAV